MFLKNCHKKELKREFKIYFLVKYLIIYSNYIYLKKRFVLIKISIITYCDYYICFTKKDILARMDTIWKVGVNYLRPT